MEICVPKELGIVKCFTNAGCSIIGEDEEHYILDCKAFTKINLQTCYELEVPSDVKQYMFPRYNDFKKYMKVFGKVYGDLLVIVPRKGDEYTSIRIKKGDIEKLKAKAKKKGIKYESIADLIRKLIEYL